MTLRYSQRSLTALQSAHPDLQRVFKRVLELGFDHSVLCGYRGRRAQEEYYAAGKSKAKFGQSPHNHTPALAVDVVPYPVDWSDIEGFYRFAGNVEAIAKSMGVELKWGGDFRGFFDGPHFELKDWRAMV